MSDSTNINDLRTDPVGSNHANVVLSTSETTHLSSSSANKHIPGINLDESTINQIVSGIQQAGISGITQLHSRDIPMNPSTISTDAQVQPNYVPTPSQHVDYIDDQEKTEYMIDQYNKSMDRSNYIDDVYNQFQVPILLAVLYFLFQLPFLRKLLYKNIPYLFQSDGNLNLNGQVFNSVLFGISYYSLDKFIEVKKA